MRVEFFWKQVSKSNACWNWLGHTTGRGYGRYSGRAAHRVSFELAGNTIAPGLVIDHTCRNRLCVRPSHLRAVTPRQNTLENSAAVTAINAVKTHCPKGHPYNKKNTILRWHKRDRGMKRNCHKCALVSYASYKIRKKARAALASTEAEGEK